MTSSPRRLWTSFLCVCRCSVRFLIRSDRIAIWTSAEPVSASALPYSMTSSALRSFVIDIVTPLKFVVKNAHRLCFRAVDTNHRDGLSLPQGKDNAAVTSFGYQFSQPVAVMVREETDSLSTSQPLRLVRRQGQCRDVVQHGLDRQNMLGQSGYIARMRVKVQREGLFGTELAHGEPPQGRNMAECAQRHAHIAGQGADIGPLAGFDLEDGVVGVLLAHERQSMDLDRPLG